MRTGGRYFYWMPRRPVWVASNPQKRERTTKPYPCTGLPYGLPRSHPSPPPTWVHPAPWGSCWFRSPHVSRGGLGGQRAVTSAMSSQPTFSRVVHAAAQCSCSEVTASAGALWKAESGPLRSPEPSTAMREGSESDPLEGLLSNRTWPSASKSERRPGRWPGLRPEASPEMWTRLRASRTRSAAEPGPPGTETEFVRSVEDVSGGGIAATSRARSIRMRASERSSSARRSSSGSPERRGRGMASLGGQLARGISAASAVSGCGASPVPARGPGGVFDVTAMGASTPSRLPGSTTPWRTPTLLTASEGP